MTDGSWRPRSGANVVADGVAFAVWANCVASLTPAPIILWQHRVTAGSWGPWLRQAWAAATNSGSTALAPFLTPIPGFSPKVSMAPPR